MNGTICLCGSNSVSDYNNTSTTPTGNMNLLATLTFNGSTYTNSGICSVSNLTAFQYYILINTSGGYVNMTLLQIQHAAGGFTTLLNGTDYNITTNTANGAPVITYIDSTTQNLTYNENIILLSKAYRRLYPVIYDINNLYLAGNTGWNISSNSNRTNLCFNYNSVNKCYYDITGNICITGDLYRSGIILTSALNNFVTNTNTLTSSLSNYASLNNPIFGG